MKNKFLSRIGQWHTPPYLRKCLTSLKALTLLLVMVASVNVWGADVTDEITQSCFSNISSSGYNNYTCTGASGAGYLINFYKNGNVKMNFKKTTVTSGLVVTSIPSGKKIKSVAATFDNGLDIYWSNTAYASSAIAKNNDETTNVSMTSGTAISPTSTATSFRLYSPGTAAAVSVITIVWTDATEPSGKDVSITADSELNLTAEGGDGTINVTYGKDVADKDINLYSDAECTTPFTGDWFTADFDASGNVEYVADANTGAAREAYIQIYVIADDTETDNTKVIKVTQAKYSAPTGTFAKFTGDLEEGDYIICSGTTAMENTTTSAPRIGYQTISVSNNKIENPNEAIIWHIAASSTDGYWTIYNESAAKYAAFTSGDGKGTLLDEISDYALWQYSVVNSNKEFSNKGKTSKYLRYNNTYGFASYGTSTGSALTLYKKELPTVYSEITLAPCENGEVSVTGAADLTSVASGTEITLGNAPADGYKLDAYDVYKTGESSTKVTITDGKFKMPAYAVTVSATFSLSIETPVLSEAAGDKDDAFNVKVSNYNSEYSYYYTLDGTDPTNASTLYVDADGIAINASCTLKVIAYDDAVTSPVVSAAYNLPLMTMDAIFAKATAVGKTETNVRIKFIDCVVTGVKGDNAYLTDNNGKGLIIYQSGHGFAVNDKLNGAVNVKVLRYNGSSEIKGLTSSTSGLTVTKDGSVTPVTTIAIASLTGVNTGAVLSYANLTSDGTDFSDGANTIKPYNTFNLSDFPSFENGDKYNVTGVYIQYNSTKEIAPRSLADLQKIEAQKYAINLASVEHGTIATDPATEAADGVKVTLSATPETGYMLSAWSVVDAESNPVEVINNQFTMPAKAVTVSATFVELPIWATTYTSNVTVGTDKVKLAEAYQPADYPEAGYDAKKDGTSSKAAAISIKVPANTTGLHYHLFAWNGEGGKTVTIKKGDVTLTTFTNVADAGASGNSPYTLQNNPADAYGYVALEGITEETTITFSTASGNQRIVLFGVNAVQPAAISINPASKDFGEVKQGFDAEQVFTLTPNAFATGTITAEISGDNVFTASAVTDNKVTVTFAPTEIKEYNATLIIKHDGEEMCSADLTGKGITPTTPEIVVSDEEIDFGKVKQDATIADQTVTVTLNYLDAATASIDDDTYFSIDKTDLVAGANTITISATASSMGVKEATITIEGTGATTKTIAVKMDVTSKWAGEYTSNVEVGSEKVIISEEEYKAVKAGTGSAQGSTTITVPEGAYALHFHAAGWNSEEVTLSVKNGDTELGSFSLYKDAGVKSNSPFTLAGNNYDTDQYFHVEFDALTEQTNFTFAATSGNRFVLYGVNQEGGIVPVLDHLAFEGAATKTEYEAGDIFDPAGLTVNAIYTLAGVEQEPVDVTEDVEWEFTPAILTAGSYDVTVKATYEDKEVSTTVAVEVTAPTPEITVDATAVGFGTVAQNAEVAAKTVAVTLKAITNATVAVSGEGADAFNVTPASLTESGNITITPITTNAGEFTATITISADGAESKTISVTMNVTDGNLPKEKVDFTEVYSYVAEGGNADFTGYAGATFSIVAAKGEGSNVPKYYASGSSVRAYAKNTITISSEKTIAFVLINYTSSKGQDDGKDRSVSPGNLVVNEKYGMWTLGAKEGTLTVGTTCSFDNIIVFYQYDEVVRSAQSENQIGTGCQTLDVVAVKGATLYQVNYTYGCYLEFMEVNYPVEAGMPIIMQADGTNDGKVEVIYGEKNPIATEGSNKNGLFGYIGAEQFDIPEGDPYYVFKGGMLRPSQGNYTTSGHAYIKLDEVPTEDQLAGSSAPRRRMSVGVERSMPTGFETIMMQKGMNKVIMNNQLYLIRDGKLFNAQGALVK